MMSYLDECLDIIRSNPGINARSITKIIFDGDDSKSNLGKIQVNLQILSKVREVEKRRGSSGLVEYRVTQIPVG